MAQRSAAKKQQGEVNAWQQQQRKDRAAEQIRQEDLRKEAEKAQQKGVQDLSGDSQVRRQQEEEARLSTYLQGQGDANATPEADIGPQATADTAMFSGQQDGDTVTKSDLAKKISEASSSAQQRIKSLAKVSSYGESFGGLGTENPLLQQEAGAGIDMANEFRRGSLGAFNVEKAVDPVQVSFTPSPMADIFSTALSLGSQGMGGKFGSPFAGSDSTSSLFPVAPKASTFVGPSVPLPPKYAGSPHYTF
jgi:hypothetical protein